MSIFDKFAQNIIDTRIKSVKKTIKDLSVELLKEKPSKDQIRSLSDILSKDISFIKRIIDQVNHLDEQELLLGKALSLIVEDANQALGLVREHYRLDRIAQMREITADILKNLPDIGDLESELGKREDRINVRKDVIAKMWDSK